MGASRERPGRGKSALLEASVVCGPDVAHTHESRQVADHGDELLRIIGGGRRSSQGATKRPKTERRAVAREFAHPLSAEQSSVMRRALSGESLFITGAAGTGKSFLLRQIVAALRGEHNGSPAELTHKRSLAQLTQRNTPLCSREAQPAGARCVGVPDAQGRG